MSEVQVGTNETDYIYNALGQLIRKSGAGGTTLLMYDEAGHILGEYTASGALIQETVWMGDTPIATLQPNGSSVSIYYVHTDHLGTPRKITRPSDNGLMWRWDPDTFGSVSPNTNPSGLGSFSYSLRFPGQYALNESGLYYNYFRDYDPQMGRYIESDPIGLGGGINTYGYVSGNPISAADPSGLVHWDGGYNITSAGPSNFGVGFAATGFTFILRSKCVDGKRATVVVDSLAGGAGAGISVYGPISIGSSTVTFEDNLSALNPNVFNGDFSVLNMGTIVASFTDFRMGGAIGDGSGWNFSSSVLDFFGARGKSHLRRPARIENCSCDGE
jgi:RHS repeat-associated protein